MCGRFAICALLVHLLSMSLLARDGMTFETSKYSGYKVLRVHPSSSGEADTLHDMLNDEHPDKFHMWHVRRSRSIAMDIAVGPTNYEELLELIDFLQIPRQTLADDLQAALDHHAEDVMSVEPGNNRFSLLRYNRWNEIYDWLNAKAHQHQHMMKVIEIGKTWEKRPILVVKLQSPFNKMSAKYYKPAIWLDAGIHSNEWIGPATLLFIINELIVKYSKEKPIRALLDHYDFYILPVFNVDGYVYTWEEDRFWRKTRSRRNATADCTGVDMNRNWPYKWGETPGVSTDPCSVIYGGPEAESEPEVRAVIQFLRDRIDVIKSYVALHSYSQLWMMPFSYTNDKPKDYPELLNISRQVVAAIRDANGKEYHYGTVNELLGAASGSSIDYTYAELGIKYSFGVELRDNGLFGSLLPPSQIIPTALETLEGIKVLCTLIRERI